MRRMPSVLPYVKLLLGTGVPLHAATLIGPQCSSGALCLEPTGGYFNSNVIPTFDHGPGCLQFMKDNPSGEAATTYVKEQHLLKTNAACLPRT